MNLTDPFCDAAQPILDDKGDKLREECGVFGVLGAREAAAIAALGLHALQHRGQEAVGITSFDGQEFYSRRGTGHVAQNFSNSEALAELPGMMAAGHVRYSTTGGSGLRNVQPLFADLATGGFAIAHNGNISNAMTLKRDLAEKGLAAAIKSLDVARQDARRQHIYIEPIVASNLPDQATEPRRIRGIFTILILGFSVFAVLWILSVGAREHKQ